MGNLYKLAFELRYQYGHIYLDRCGRTINAIQRSAPEWLTTDPGPQGTSLLSIRNGCVFSFSSTSLSLIIDHPIDEEITQESVESFQEQVGLLSAIVVDELGLEEFARIGLRSVIAYPMKDGDDAERWMNSLGWYSLSDTLRVAFGQTVESSGISAVFVESDRHYRIAMNSVEKPPQVSLGTSPVQLRTSTLSKGQDKAFKAQLLRKRKDLTARSFAASIDIDVYQQDPIAPDAADFTKTSLDQVTARLRKLATST